mmetsp:Transcript_64375/g.178944  ORF Transcript_64375/g.178944 Transcript_64375/m.178944 type:complete len:202 (+) Transcript_64375:475-1080(+)
MWWRHEADLCVEYFLEGEREASCHWKRNISKVAAKVGAAVGALVAITAICAIYAIVATTAIGMLKHQEDKQSATGHNAVGRNLCVVELPAKSGAVRFRCWPKGEAEQCPQSADHHAQRFAVTDQLMEDEVRKQRDRDEAKTRNTATNDLRHQRVGDHIRQGSCNVEKDTKRPCRSAPRRRVAIRGLCSFGIEVRFPLKGEA